MFEFLENVKTVIATHKVVSIAAAGVVGASAIGAGGYAIYNHVNNVDMQENEVVAETNNDDVYIPEFKSVVISGESVEKDFTIYISDTNDECITGTNFQIKLIEPEAAEGLQTYIDAINDINTQISEYTGESVTVSDADTDEDSEDTNTADTEEAEADTEKNDAEETDTEETTVSDKTAAEILAERNPEVTVTNEDGEVVETLVSSISDDPLYQLYLDKETAIQAYSVALQSIEGNVYTDDDADGVISESDVDPGEYVVALVDDASADTLYDPVEYDPTVEVKEELVYEVQTEIIKEVKADDSSEDGQKTEVTETEETLADTVEYVESSKVANGSKGVATTDAVAPTSTASSSTATVKSGGVTSVSHTITTETTTYTITIKYQLEDADGNTVTTVTAKELTVNEGDTPSYSAPSTYSYDSVTYNLTSSPSFAAASADTTYTYVYQAEETEEETAEETTTYTVTVKYEYIDGDSTEYETIKTETLEEGAEYSYSADSEITYNDATYSLTSDSSVSGTVGTSDVTVTFTYKKESSDEASIGKNGVVAASYSTDSAIAVATRIFNDGTRTGAAALRLLLTATTTTTTTETATLDMSYSAGVFTISGSSNVGTIKINGSTVSGTTYTVSGNGDYKLTGVATFSDGETDSSLSVTYTVSGYGSSSTDALVDSSGNQLYLDEDCTEEATAADYVEGQTYYYKADTYTYYGWQTINGVTYYYDKNGNVVTGTQVIQGVSYNFGSDGALLVNGTGIDVSKYQGNIDWSQASSAVGFAIIRCGYRGMYDGALHEDSYFYKNMKNAKANGVSTGIYIYSTALTEAEAVQEASMAVAMANKAGGCSYPIYIDMEDSTRGVRSLSNAQRNAIINAFCATVQSAGYKAGVYANKTWMTNYIDVSSLSSSCYIWVAQYNTTCTYSGKYSMWQYSSKGSVPGISGNVDMNKSYF